MVALKTVTLPSLPHLSLRSSTTPAPSPPATAGLPSTSGNEYFEAPQQAAKPVKESSSFGLSAMAKRSVSATGLTRRPTSEQPAPRSKSIVPPLSRPASAAILDTAESSHISTNPATSSSRNLLSLLNPRSSTPANSPPVSVPSTPSQASSATLAGAAPAISQLEASYVSKISLKLGEAVNKVFPAAMAPDNVTGVVWKGRCSPRPDRAKELGEIIFLEAQQSAYDPYLLRTLLRSAVLRTLTIFLSRIEALVLTTSTEPSSALYWVPKSVAELGHLSQPAPQRFNVEVVRAAAEVSQALSKVLQSTTPAMPSFVQDALLPWIGKLDNLVNRIVSPMVLEIKKTIAVTIARARDTVQRSSSGNTIAASVGTASAGTAVPVYLKDLCGQLTAAKKLLVDVLSCGKESDKWIVGIATHVTWKGMLAFAARPCPSGEGSGPLIETKSHIKRSVGITQTTSRSKTLPLMRNGKRSPSPPHYRQVHEDETTSKMIEEVHIFRQLIARFAHDVLPADICDATPTKNEKLRNATNIQELCEAFALLPELPPMTEGQETDLAQEAMHEALLALSSFELVLRALKWPEELKTVFLWDDQEDSSSDEEGEGLPRMTPSAVFGLVGPHSPATRVAAQRNTPQKAPVKAVVLKEPSPDLDRALDTLPPLITFHLLASRLPVHKIHSFRLPHEIWNLPGGWQEYEAHLTGFAMGESWAAEIGWQMTDELDKLKKEDQGGGSEDRWTELLRLAIKAES